MKTFEVFYKFHFYATAEVEAESEEQARLIVEGYHKDIAGLRYRARNAEECGVEVLHIEEIEGEEKP